MYTIGQAARRSGVSVPLLRAWERRYGVVRPLRTPAGYRLYDEGAIAMLRAMRDLVAAGWSPRQAATRLADAPPTAVHSFADDEALEPGEATVQTAARQLADRFVDAARLVDQEAAGRALDEAYAAASFEAATDAMVLPALRAVGDAWRRGELDVAAEHAVSAAVLRRIGAAFNAAGRIPGAPVVLVGMPPGCRHEIAALAFATAARRIGLDVIYLGADVPAASWLAAVDETRARAVVIGAVMRRDAAAAAAVLVGLRSAHSETILAVGGRYAGAVAMDGVLVLPAPLRAAAEALRTAIDAG